MQRSELKIGDRVFYSMEDYESGEDIVYEGYVHSIHENHRLEIGNMDLCMTFYEVSDRPGGEPRGIGMQRNCLYTLKELFEIKDAYEYQQRRLENQGGDNNG